MSIQPVHPAQPASAARLALVALVLVILAGLGGCSSMETIGDWARSLRGHWAILMAARPVDEVVGDAATDADLRHRLERARALRDFASRELALPDNASYRRYAELGRPVAVWNVVAAPELSLELRRWCFPVVGCVGYRGFYDRAQADTLASQLRQQGLEVSVYGVPAYSTLGKLPALDFFADPLLSSFIRDSEADLARLIFHELAHQVAFAPGDTTFNESFATAVERLGVRRWLDTQADEASRAEHERTEQRREAFRALTRSYRQKLEVLYAEVNLDEAQRRDRKVLLFAAMRDEARTLLQRWGQSGSVQGAGYARWFERANNASMGVLSAYNAQVPDFERLFERCGGEFPRFYAEVRRLAGLPQEQRQRELSRPV
jgi:predicted aminopeptidase